MALRAHPINVTVAATATRVTTSHIWVTAVTFQLDDGSTGPAYIGLVGVTGATDCLFSLAPGQMRTFEAGEFWGGRNETFDISQFYVVGVVADILHVSYFLRNA